MTDAGPGAVTAQWRIQRPRQLKGPSFSGQTETCCSATHGHEPALPSEGVLIFLPHTALQVSEGKSQDMASFERADRVKNNDNLQDPESIFLTVFLKEEAVSEKFCARLQKDCITTIAVCVVHREKK